MLIVLMFRLISDHAQKKKKKKKNRLESHVFGKSSTTLKFPPATHFRILQESNVFPSAKKALFAESTLSADTRSFTVIPTTKLTLHCMKTGKKIKILHRKFHHVVFGAKSPESFRANLTAKRLRFYIF